MSGPASVVDSGRHGVSEGLSSLGGPGQVQLRPHDAISVAGGLGSPVARAGEGLDDVEPVMVVAGDTRLPGAAEVFDLDPDGAGEHLAADGEELARAGGMKDRVGCELAGDQDSVLDLDRGAAVQVRGDPSADLDNLIGPAVEPVLILHGRFGRCPAH